MACTMVLDEQESTIHLERTMSSAVASGPADASTIASASAMGLSYDQIELYSKEEFSIKEGVVCNSVNNDQDYDQEASRDRWRQCLLAFCWALSSYSEKHVESCIGMARTIISITSIMVAFSITGALLMLTFAQKEGYAASGVQDLFAWAMLSAMFFLVALLLAFLVRTCEARPAPSEMEVVPSGGPRCVRWWPRKADFIIVVATLAELGMYLGVVCTVTSGGVFVALSVVTPTSICPVELSTLVLAEEWSRFARTDPWSKLEMRGVHVKGSASSCAALGSELWHAARARCPQEVRPLLDDSIWFTANTTFDGGCESARRWAIQAHANNSVVKDFFLWQARPDDFHSTAHAISMNTLTQDVCGVREAKASRDGVCGKSSLGGAAGATACATGMQASFQAEACVNNKMAQLMQCHNVCAWKSGRPQQIEFFNILWWLQLGTWIAFGCVYLYRCMSSFVGFCKDVVELRKEIEREEDVMRL